MVKLGIEPTTPQDRALFKCPGAACGGFLVPYEIWRSDEGTTVFATCYTCKKRYKFMLDAMKRDDWLPALRNFTWRCAFCGEPRLDVTRAVGNKVLRVQATCDACGKALTKKIEHRTYDVLMAGTIEKPAVIGAESPKEHAPARKIYIICPACDLEIEETFKGYCPACGFVFSAVIEEKR